MTETLHDKLAKIEKGERELLRHFSGIFKVQADLYISDFIVIASLKRTLALASGFRSLIENRNFTSAAALLRLQLDTALRLYAATLYSHPEEYAKVVFHGHKVDKLKDRNGNRLTDRYLVKKLSERNPWIDPMYNHLCDFVHFSNRHFFTSIAKYDEEEHTIQMLISAEDPPRREEAYFEAVDAYYKVMSLSGTLAAAWLAARKNGYGTAITAGQ